VASTVLFEIFPVQLDKTQRHLLPGGKGVNTCTKWATKRQPDLVVNVSWLTQSAGTFIPTAKRPPEPTPPLIGEEVQVKLNPGRARMYV
jgi:hypothetical protein